MIMCTDALNVLDDRTEIQAGCLFQAIKAYHAVYQLFLKDNLIRTAFTLFKVLSGRNKRSL